MWVGEFHATVDELWDWCEKNVDDPAEFDLILRMVVSTEVYRDWWREVSGKRSQR